MKRLLLVTLLAMMVPTLHATDWSDVVKSLERSIVFLEVGDAGGCTSWVINQEKHYLLTAAHCEDKNLWADRVKAEVISKDSKKDLLVLLVKELDPTRPALKLAAKNPVIGQEVMSAGFGFALERPFFRQAHVQDDAMVPDMGIGGPFVSLDNPFVGGQSGGPVVNTAGEVVMIVQRGDQGTTGIGMGAEAIRERVGRFFGK